MASGKPDWNRVTTIQGLSGSDFVPIKVDSNGQMYIALTGQSIGVSNHPSDYFKEGENVEVNNHPSDYFKANEAVGSIANNVTVDQSDADRLIKGKDGATPYYIAVDSSGIILARLKGAYGGSLYDVLLDDTGIMLARLKGYDGSALKDVLVDSSGKIITSIQGKVVETELLLLVCDFGDDNPVTEWTLEGDASARDVVTDPVKEGSAAIQVTVDASESGDDFAGIESTTDRGDWSSYQNDWVYVWVYLPTLAYLATAGHAFKISIGNTSANYYNWEFDKADLVQGWNLLKCDLANSDSGTGITDWTDIDWVRCRAVAVVGNTDDFTFTVDYMVVVRRPASADSLIDIAVDSLGVMQAQISGDYGGRQKVIAVDSAGVMKANITTQDLGVLNTRPFFGKHDTTMEDSTSNAAGEQSLRYFGSDTPGRIVGGFLYIDADASYKTAYLKIKIDGAGKEVITFEEMNEYNLNLPGTHTSYLLKYDDTNFIYCVAFTPGLAFLLNVDIILGRIAVQMSYQIELIVERDV